MNFFEKDKYPVGDGKIKIKNDKVICAELNRYENCRFVTGWFLTPNQYEVQDGVFRIIDEQILLDPSYFIELNCIKD